MPPPGQAVVKRGADPTEPVQISPEGSIMSITLRNCLVTLIAAVAVALGAAPVHAGSTVLADPVCPAGTNWDNGIHACR